MSIIELPLRVLRAQYRLARLPLQFIEDRWIARLDAEAPGRLIYERSFGALDAAVGGVLGDSTLRKRGAVRARRSEVRGEAAVHSMAAAQRRRQAGAQLKDSLDEAAAAREAAAEQQRLQRIDEAEEKSAAKAALDDARDKRGAAEAKRAQAEQVAELADIEKRNRRAGNV